MSSAAAWRRPLSAAALALPVAIWIRDGYVSAYRVRGSSMEPALMDGDVLLVRRADILPGRARPKTHPTDLASEEEERRDAHDRDMLRRVEERERSFDVGDGIGGDGWGLLRSRPPEALPGEVVVFKSPTKFPPLHHVKRVVALGGQRVRPADRYKSVESVPAYGLWLEGDNREGSEDSCEYGPVNRKLLVGKADRVIWPPLRWGHVGRKRPNYGRAWWN